jgi:hypothetical protein
VQETKLAMASLRDEETLLLARHAKPRTAASGSLPLDAAGAPARRAFERSPSGT